MEALKEFWNDLPAWRKYAVVGVAAALLVLIIIG